MSRTYNFVSADSHIESPTNMCNHWIPEKYQEWAPQQIMLADGTEAYVIKNSKPAFTNMSLFSGHTPEDFTPFGTAWTGHGAGTPQERLKDQDADNVDAEILFASPQFPFLAREITDRQAYCAVIAAYNSWLGQEYCAVAPDRLVGMGIVPTWDIDAAVDELRHCKEVGLKGVTLGALPSGHRYPSPEDDRFWAAATELDMPICVHVQLYPPQAKEPYFIYPKKPDTVAPGYIDRFSRYGTRGAADAVQMVMSGMFDRFPTLKIYFAENGIGWLPVFLYQFDRQYERNYHWAEHAYGLKPLDRLPSEYARDHLLWGFFDDPIGIKMRDEIGVDTILWGSDFPHVESSWPHSMELMDEHFAGVDTADRRKILANNAVEFFRLDRQ